MAEAVDMDAFCESFKAFAIQGDTKATGKDMTNKNWAKMCKDCKVIDGKKVTGTDVDIVFSKVKDKSARTITVDQCKKALEELSAKRFPKDDDGKNKTFALIAGKKPGTTGVTKASKTGGVDRMTDTSQYTGSHKERFDASGKGKGIEGREDKAENTGYVGDYKGKDTYDKKVKK
ncbi:tubulin polymerization-promoting protein family member 3-like isoform X1 [Branchiostoma lanceolatum]|uniref:tubulin polymerization-promoting protein family member 3-like isoform X1 n=2 Tax=Branchiostoma lanceolatum TaxID=7740 RepID=UPI003452EC84